MSSESFPDRTSLIRLAGAVLAEQHDAEQRDEWTEGCRHLGLDVPAWPRVGLAGETDDDSTIDEEMNRLPLQH